MSQDVFIPSTKAEQVETLHRMYEAAMQYDERLRHPAVPAPVLRIIEESVVPVPVQQVSLHAQLRQSRLEHRRMQVEVCRGLLIAGAVLAVMTLWAATLNSGGLTLLLGVLSLSCPPLYLLAAPEAPEVR